VVAFFKCIWTRIYPVPTGGCGVVVLVVVEKELLMPSDLQ